MYIHDITCNHRFTSNRMTDGAKESMAHVKPPATASTNHGTVVPRLPLLSMSRRKPAATGPGFGFYNGSCTSGISSDFPGNRRQVAWERYNNDKHLKKNIRNMKATFRTQPKKDWKAHLKERREIIKNLKDYPDVEVRSIAGARYLRQRLDSLEHRLSEHKKVKPKLIFRLVKKISLRYSLTNEHVGRLVMEVVFPESQDGCKPILLSIFRRRLQYFCERFPTCQPLLMGYLERRFVADQTVTPESIQKLIKHLYHMKILHADTILAWNADLLPSVAIDACVELTHEKRAKLRELLGEVVQWISRNPAPLGPTKPRGRRQVLSARRPSRARTHVQVVSDAPATSRT